MRYVLPLFVCMLSACGACEKGGSAVDGPRPYVRCMDVEAEDAREGTIGRVRFERADRVLELTAPSPLRIVAFRGAGANTSGLGRAMLGAKEHAPDLVFVLGDLGATEAHVKAHLTAFEQLGALVVVLASGADVAEALHDAFADSSLTRVFDGRGLRAVVAGNDVFVLVSGSPEGRYAASDAHCGASTEDLEALEDDAPDGRRWLVSWAAPSGGGPLSVSRGYFGVEAGSPPLAALARALEAKGGIFGFPTSRALMPSNAAGSSLVAVGTTDAALRLVVTRITGEPDSLHDGGRVSPGAALLELSAPGLAYVGTSVSSGH